MKNTKRRGLIMLTGLIMLLSIFSVLAGVEQTVTVRVVPGKVFVHHPFEGGIYDNRMVFINLTLSNEADVVYSVTHERDGKNYEEDTRSLCRDCKEYGFYRARPHPFYEGLNSVKIHLVFETGEIDEYINFTVDFKEPLIYYTLPAENSVVNKGEFLIKYSEENLQNITLFYGTGKNIKKAVKEDCESGIKKECVFYIDLNEFDGKKIEYWFEVRDYFREVNSKKTKIKVDLTSPVLSVYLPKDGEYKGNVPFNISVSETARVEYIDKNNLNKLRKLCLWCDEFGFLKEKFKQLKEGFYSLLIRVVDKAGNSDVVEVNFTVLKTCKSISQCGKISSELYCDGDTLINKKTTPTCVDKKYCENVIEKEVVEECEYGCENKKCLPKPKCSVDSDCNEDYCDEWYDNYCEVDVYHDRTCHDFGCFEGECIKDVYEDVELVEECLDGCENEECLEPSPECLVNSDCQTDYYSNNYCDSGSVVRDFYDFSCVEGGCVENVIQEIIEICGFGCQEGICSEPSPENHNVGLKENYDGFGHAIKINDPDNNLMLEDIPIVDCTSKYDIKFLTENLGNFTEDVEINLKIRDSENNIVYEDTKTKEDLETGGTTTAGNKNNFVFNLSAGDYSIFVDTSIIGFDDANLTNNHAERQVEVVC